MKNRIIHIILILFPLHLAAQEATGKSGTRLTMETNAIVQIDTIYAANDSILFNLSIRPEHLEPGTSETLTLTPRLTDNSHSVDFPSVVLNGHRRAAYDRRERSLDYRQQQHAAPYRILTCDTSGKFPMQELKYVYRLPYATWMSHAALHLAISGKECCETYSLGELELTADLDLSDSWLTHIVEHWRTDTIIIYRDRPENNSEALSELRIGENLTPHAASLILVSQPQANVYRIWFLLNETQIDKRFADNSKILARLDSALTTANKRITSIRLTGCSSPDGPYFGNDSIARYRAAAMAQYLKEKYPATRHHLLPPTYKIENWDGLEYLLQLSHYPWREQALEIIRRVPIHQYRETKLMDLQGGTPYREMYKTLFPLLRYADVELEYEQKETGR